MMNLFSGASLEAKPWFRSVIDGPRLLSLSLHVGLVVLALIPWASKQHLLPPPLIEVALCAPAPLTAPPDDLARGGGGGGKHEPKPASLGKLPRAADKQLVPPAPEPPRNPDPSLVAEPTVVAPELASLPALHLLSIGDPSGIAGPPSAGPGSGFGDGTGDGHGIGEGKGPGVGPGEDGGFGGKTYSIGGGVSAPILINEVRPDYPEEARKARFQGTVSLETIVREDGSVQIVRILHGVGFGMDQQAIRAVLQWKFKPARMNGKPVAAYMNVEVNFNLR
jgi:TonB family protein